MTNTVDAVDRTSGAELIINPSLHPCFDVGCYIDDFIAFQGFCSRKMISCIRIFRLSLKACIT